MTKIRPIVKAAFRVDELVYQFTRIDVEDGLLCADEAFPEYDAIVESVNAQYSDAYIIGEANNRLDITNANLSDRPYGEDLKAYKRDYRQLNRFIEKWS